MRTDYEFAAEEFELPAGYESNEEFNRFRQMSFKPAGPRPSGFRRTAPAFGRTAPARQARAAGGMADARRHPQPRPRPRPWRPWRRRAASSIYLQTPHAAAGSEYVRWVQTMLNQALNLQLAEDGIMNVQTRSAIRSFQQQNGLPVSGVVGPDTERALQAAAGGQRGLTGEPPSAPPENEPAGSAEPAPQSESLAYLLESAPWEGEISRSSPDYIKWVQQSLNKILGLRLVVDGVSGTQTRSAIRSFQQQAGLTVDGIVGPQTEAALIAGGAGSPPGSATSPYVPSPSTPPATGGQLSGAHWVSHFPTSKSTADLVQPFRGNADRFIAALRAAGAAVVISATYRPPNRAYLMYYAWRIAREGLNPASVPPQAGVNIRWVHTNDRGNVDLAASRAAADAMVGAYGIVYKPALASRHTEGRAIDMNVTWSGTLRIANGRGQVVTITSSPRTGADNRDLHAVGATYGVIKLVGDAPHWSDDGH